MNPADTKSPKTDIDEEKAKILAKYFLSVYQIFFIFFFRFIHMALNLVSHSVVLLPDFRISTGYCLL
jgi:hypothetical protein